MSNDWITAIMQIVLSSGAICVALLVFRWLFRGRVSPRLTATLWLILVARLCLPTTIDVPFSLLGTQAQETMSPAVISSAPGDAPSEVPEADGTRLRQTDAEDGAGSGSRTSKEVPAPVEGVLTPEMPLLSWEAALGIVLAGGVAVGVVWTAWQALCSRRQYASGARPAPGYVVDEARRAACALGLRHVPRVRMMAGATTPALTVSLRPTVILPESLALSGDSVRIRFALLHELTHLRRGDHVTALLMRVLQIIWWFNPFAWLGFAFARKDMEAACDRMATRGLDRPERAEYARMLVDLASGTQLNPVLAMRSQTHTKEVEARIRNLYGPKRTSAGVRTVALVLVGVLGVACFTTACHPMAKETATSSVTQAASEDPADESVDPRPTSAATEPAALTAVGRWKQDSQLADGISLHADVDMMAPEISQVSVQKIQAQEMTQEKADALIEALAGPDARFWDAQEPDQAQLEDEMRMIQESRETALAEGDTDLAERARLDLEALRQKWEAAAPQGLATSSDTMFTYRVDRHTAEPIIEEGKSVIRVTSESPDGRVASISVDRRAPDATSTTRNGSRFEYAEGPYTYKAEDESWLLTLQEARSASASAGDADELADLDKEIGVIQARLERYNGEGVDLGEARRQAVAFLDSLGVAGLEMTMCAQGLLDPYASAVEAAVNRYDSAPDPASSRPVAVMQFVRGVQGIPGTIDTGSIGGDADSAEQAPDIALESLVLVVDQGGAPRAIKWHDAAQVVETADPDAVLLDCEEVEKRAHALVESWVLASAQDFPDVESVTGVVDDAQLAMTYVQDGEEASPWSLVPAWEINVRLVTDEEREAPNGKGGRMSQELDFGTLILNAHDGSPIVDADWIS